jgi:hypothetical protein
MTTQSLVLQIKELVELLADMSVPSEDKVLKKFRLELNHCYKEVPKEHKVSIKDEEDINNKDMKTIDRENLNNYIDIKILNREDLNKDLDNRAEDKEEEVITEAMAEEEMK